MPTIRRRVAYSCRIVCWALPPKQAWHLIGKIVPTHKVVPVRVAVSSGAAKDLAYFGDGKLGCAVRDTAPKPSDIFVLPTQILSPPADTRERALYADEALRGGTAWRGGADTRGQEAREQRRVQRHSCRRRPAAPPPGSHGCPKDERLLRDGDCDRGRGRDRGRLRGHRLVPRPPLSGGRAPGGQREQAAARSRDSIEGAPARSRPPREGCTGGSTGEAKLLQGHRHRPRGRAPRSAGRCGKEGRRGRGVPQSRRGRSPRLRLHYARGRRVGERSEGGLRELRGALRGDQGVRRVEP